jgi:starch-binding outer membrane protein, SusD/RagB family
MKKLFTHKNKIFAGILLIALHTLVSCKKLIEIPTNPPTAITQAQQFSDSTSAMAAIAGVYTYNVGNGFAYSDANLTITTGLSSDELSTTFSSDEQQFYSYTLTPLTSSISSLWGYPYQSLYQVNDVLNGITNNNQLSASFVKQITGEMKVVRALYYFNMINLFGGVPLVTSTKYNTTAHIPRASVDAVYTQILTDLTDAKQKLSVNYPSAGRTRPNLYTALTLLAKVHLYQGQWQAAYNEADSVIKSGTYSLEPNLNNVFLDGSQEAVWQLPAQTSFYGTADAENFVPDFSDPTYLLTPFLLSQFEAGDLRLQNWVGTAVLNNQNVYYPFKYKNVEASTTPTEDQMVLRLGEIYLIRAEAAAHPNSPIYNLPQALADINIIRKRAGLPNTTADVTSSTAVLNAVMHERQTELFCEWGNRWFDLKRNVTPATSAATVLGAEKTGYIPNAALYPLPQTQIQLDNLLIQNPGYN